MFAFWTTLLLLFLAVRGKEVCYVRLGCFTDDIPWAGTVERPIARLPWSPQEINTRFLLYTKKNLDDFQEITAIHPETIDYSNFNASKITRFITHGFIDQGEERWLSDMCKVQSF
uniref:Triacylglycerol lipase n=1 Tax=Pseudonaja textilis TaxID=8673 RepID=A0A670Y9G9_PSETE